MSTKNLQSASLILDRIKHAYNLKSDAQLASYFKKDPSTISSWRRRNSVDYPLIFTKCHDLSANFLIYGDLPLKRAGVVTEAIDDPVIQELGEAYGESEMIQRIHLLKLDPETKLALLRAYIRILEERERQQE